MYSQRRESRKESESHVTAAAAVVAIVAANVGVVVADAVS